MIEMEMPKDIRKFKTKLIGPLTLRETICVGLTVGIGYLLRRYTVGLPDDIRNLLTIVIASPILACGWLTPYGLPFEQYAVVFLFSTFLSPKQRKYKTEMEFIYEEEEDEELLIGDNEKNIKKSPEKPKAKKPSGKYKSKEYASFK